MTTLKRTALVFCLVLSFVTLCRAQGEQRRQQSSPSVEVTADSYQARFAVLGEAQSVRVEVFAPSGEKVFDSGAVFGRDVEWYMTDARGGRVADGIYHANVTVTDLAGKAQSRAEQIVVSNAVQGVIAAAPEEPSATTMGSGTSGKIAKFTAATVLGDSIMTENTGKLGINVAPPTATLHVNGLQPAPVAVNGANAATLLQTSGGKGGNTTAAGKTGGKGASIALVAGQGGNAPAGGVNGTGGSITLQPGSAGTGGGGGAAGNVLIAPTDGKVAIGTNTSSAKLTVETATELNGIISFNQTPNSVAIYGAAFNGISTGVEGKAMNGPGVKGSSGQQGVLGEGTPGVEGKSSSGTGVVGRSDNATGVVGTSGGILGQSSVTGIGVHGGSNKGIGVKGESSSNYGVFGKATGSKAAVYGEGVGEGVHGKSTGAGIGVFGENTGAGAGVSGISQDGRGVFGSSTTAEGVKGSGAVGVLGQSNSGTGVSGLSVSGYAGLFTGKARVTTNFEVGGNQFFGNTTRQMINLYNQDYGIGIQGSTLYFRVANTAGYNWYMGGVHNNTQNSPGTGGTSLMRLDSAGNLFTKGAVNPVSDRNAKMNFAAVNTRFVLDKLAGIPIQTWSYKTDSDLVRHLGPVAQDFRAAFNLGADDKHISTVDADGVALAAIQGLYQLMLEKEKQNEEKDRKIEQLARKLEEIESQLAEVRRDARRQRATRRKAR